MWGGTCHGVSVSRKDVKIEKLFAAWEEEFCRKEGERRGKPRGTGVEFKFPVVDKEGFAATQHQIEALWSFLAEKGWKTLVDPHYGKPVGATRPSSPYPDVITTETGFCKLEVSLGYTQNLHLLVRKYKEVKRLLREFSSQREIYFLGLGLQPRTPPGPHLMAKKARNLFWNKVFNNERVVLFTASATNQVHVDVSREEAVPALNVFNGLAGVQIALHANSTLWEDQLDLQEKARAVSFWEWWLPGSSRVGMTGRPFHSLPDYLKFLANFRPVYVVREGRYLGVYRYPTFLDYYTAAHPGGEAETGNLVPLVPEPADFGLHTTFCWHDARLSDYFTLENRVNCQQPSGTEFTVAAFTLGLIEELEEAAAFVSRFNWSFLRKLRKAAVADGLAAAVGCIRVGFLAREVLALAEEGLKKRRLNEECYLRPLWERLERGACPADDVRITYARAGIEGVLRDYRL